MLKSHDKEHGETIVKRGRRGDHDDGHGGAWKVAFADFCLALLALFLIMWLMATRQQEALQQLIKETSAGQIAGPGTKPEIAGGPRGSLIERHPLPKTGQGDADGGPSTQRVSYDSPQDLHKLKQALMQMSAEAGLGQNVSAVVTPFGLRVQLHDTDREGMFMRGSPLPSPRFARLLRKMGPVFARMENQMLIVGHTDSLQYANPGATAYSNWSLSTNRGLAARAELLNGGMRKETVLQVVGMADRAPLDNDNTRADVNRRIELLILTRAQAASVIAMFGEPDTRRAPGLQVDDDAVGIDRLRQQLGN